ncbi:hypothetical protein KLP40_20315 [Hymenobacter sp. NST-14]|uniref:DNA translocase FtsK n=1 Tax=Hymenobacter piscis TaxID=2839984 RepID=UPI001C0383FB|nr:DNA translocase FtsK [Hymenobacter piscis]MBT9395521.1 hypothetical protein [Hymenobacter piscis]
MTSAATLADNLLSEWEAHRHLAPIPDYTAQRARLAQQLANMCVVLQSEADSNVDEDDARTVLRPATSLRVGSTGTSGPGRAIRAAQHVAQLAQAGHLGPEPGGPAATALLVILSQPTTELEMDELNTITEYLRQTVCDNQTELIFGHGLQPDSSTELWVGVLLGYSSEPLPPRPPRLLQPAPPATSHVTGRDFYFEAAARLFVQRRRAGGWLLQRQFGLGYNRTGRLLDELVAAGVIGPESESRGWRVLVTDEAGLEKKF